MARTEISVTEVPFQNAVLYSGTAADAANGMMFVNDGQSIAIVENGSGGDVTVGILAEADLAGRTVDFDYTMSDGERFFFGPYRPIWWNQRTGDDLGKVYVDFDVDTSVTIQVVKFIL